MKTPNGEKPPKADAKEVLAEFTAKKELLEEFCRRTKDLIEACLQDEGIRYQSVQARVKGRKKLEAKYLDPKKDYRKLDEITDQAGLRVITYYEDDVDRVAKLIKREFTIDPDNSVDKREIEPDRFGYRAINYVCTHSSKRSTDVEYKRFSGVVCEIQITSVLTHAWSEIEHEWYDLKDGYPREIKRRFSRLIALLEVAEAEFIEIRKLRKQTENSVGILVEALILDLPLDQVSIRSLVEKDPLIIKADKLVVEALEASLSDEINENGLEFRAKSGNLAGMSSLLEVHDQLDKHLSAVVEFARRCRKEIWNNLMAGRRANRGISLYQLYLFLVASRGAESLSIFQKELGIKGGESDERLVKIAQEILGKPQ